MKEKGPVAKFEEWVKQNFIARPLAAPPDSWDRTRELYYKIDKFYYGPIIFDEIPERIR